MLLTPVPFPQVYLPVPPTGYIYRHNKFKVRVTRELKRLAPALRIKSQRIALLLYRSPVNKLNEIRHVTKALAECVRVATKIKRVREIEGNGLFTYGNGIGAVKSQKNKDDDMNFKTCGFIVRATQGFRNNLNFENKFTVMFG